MIQSLHISNNILTHNQDELPISNAEALYAHIGSAYPKWFKMDWLCKWAWLCAEKLLKNNDGGFLYQNAEKEKIGLILCTTQGCLDVDKRFLNSMQDIASPALFVYTLPNIMLGEVSIRHGFKGEQLCFVHEQYNVGEIKFWAEHLLTQKGMQYCLVGYVDSTGTDNVEAHLFWVNKENVAEIG